MVGAIDAVCEVAERIIGRLKEGAATEGSSVLAGAVGDGAGSYPPTPAMKRFADSLVRQTGIKPPPGYKTSIAICRRFLNEHAPKNTADEADGQAVGTPESKSVSPAQLSYATKIAIGKGVVIPDEAKADTAAMSAWIDQNRPLKRRNGGRKSASRPARSAAPRSTAPKTRSRKPKVAAASTTDRTESETDTPLRIPYGNKDIALRLGARYRPGGWYAPIGVDLTAFGERGWL
jgi:DNA topoisomerase-3